MKKYNKRNFATYKFSTNFIPKEFIEKTEVKRGNKKQQSWLKFDSGGISF